MTHRHQNLYFALSLLAAALPAAGQVTEVRLVTGDLVPAAGPGVTLGRVPSAGVVNNDAGQIALNALLAGTPGGVNDSEALLLAPRTGGVEVVAQRGVPLPDGNGTFGFLSVPSLADGGRMTFASLSTDSAAFPDDGEIRYGYDGTQVNPVARAGSPPPEGDGVFGPAFFGLEQGRLAMNDAGQFSLKGGVRGAQNGVGSDMAESGLYRGAVDGTITMIARRNRPIPGLPLPAGSVASDVSESPLIDATGRVAWEGGARDGINGDSLGGFVFLGNGTTTRVLVAEDQPVPGGGTVQGIAFRNTSIGSLNPAGTYAGIVRIGGIPTGGEAIVTATTSSDPLRGDLRVLARERDPLPDDASSVFRNPFFSDDFGVPTISDAGGVAFFSNIGDVADPFGTPDQSGVFYDPAGPDPLQTILRTGDPLPGGGTYKSALIFGETFALNAAGQLAFAVPIAGTLDDEALLFHDPDLGLFEVVREGDALLGGTVVEWNFDPGFAAPGNNAASGLNALGEVAYRFELDDGRSGVAVWSIPEPSAAAGLLITVGSLLIRRRR